MKDTVKRYKPYFENSKSSEELLTELEVTIDILSKSIEDFFPIIKEKLHINRKPLSFNKIFMRAKGFKESFDEDKWKKIQELFEEAERKTRVLAEEWRRANFDIIDNYPNFHSRLNTVFNIVCKQLKDAKNISAIDITNKNSSILVLDNNIHYLLMLLKHYYEEENPDLDQLRLVFEEDEERASLEEQISLLIKYLDKIKNAK